MLKNQRTIQAISETLIPLLGFFFFDWGLYFILLYYCIDLIFTALFTQIKARKIYTYAANQAQKSTWIKNSILSVALVVALIVGIHLVIPAIVQDIDFKSEIRAFLSYTEAGIPISQGYIIFPLVFLGNYQLYKMNFLMRAQFRMYSIAQLFRKHIAALMIGIIGCGLALVFAYTLHLNEVIYLVLIVIVKLIIDLRMSL